MSKSKLQEDEQINRIRNISNIYKKFIYKKLARGRKYY